MERYDASGTMSWSTPLANPDNTPTDFGIGEARMEFGNGRYGAYYHVHSNDGHEGDTLKWVTASNGAEDTEWGWGCSHSMSNLLRYSPGAGDFLPVCVTDCFPGTEGGFQNNAKGGIYLWASRDYKVMDVDAGCNGDVAGEVGSAALAPNGWKLVFNAHQAPLVLGQGSYNENTMNQDIGFSTIGTGPSAGAVVWLTSTDNVDEADSSIARWEPDGDGAEQYVVGWSEGEEATVHRLARVDAAGAFLEGPIDVSALVGWGRRDDPFRQHHDRDVIWAWFDSPGSSTLHVARIDAGSDCE
jgi:hypothetical protein